MQHSRNTPSHLTSVISRLHSITITLTIHQTIHITNTINAPYHNITNSYTTSRWIPPTAEEEAAERLTYDAQFHGTDGACARTPVLNALGT